MGRSSSSNATESLMYVVVVPATHPKDADDGA